MEVIFNGTSERIDSVHEFASAWDRFQRCSAFELWLYAEGGCALCMLYNGKYAWLMYLRYSGDSGLVSVGFTLGNGEVNEFPVAWCIDIGNCYQAMTHFLANRGAMPDFIAWQRG